MNIASSIELSNYRVFINELGDIKSRIKNISDDYVADSKSKLVQLLETQQYLEERIAEIYSRIP